MRKIKRIIPILLTLLLAVSAFTSASAVTPQSLRIPTYTITDCEWDENGRIISETAHDTNGNPALNSRGFYKAEYTWDELGNPLTETYTGLNGELVTTDTGYAKVVFTYENNSRKIPHLIAEERYAADGGRAVIPGSYSYRLDNWKEDQIVSTSYYDAEGNLTQPTGGYAQILYEVEEDENVQVITKRYLDADGAPLIGGEGGAKVVYIYAKNETAAVNARVDNMGLGMMLAVVGMAQEGVPNLMPESSRGELYDTTGQNWKEKRQPMLLSTEIFGADDSSTLGAKRWHREIRSYDDKGNLTRVDFTGTDGEPVISATTYASVVNTYDEYNRVIQIDYLDCEGNLIKMLNGYARVTYEYYGGGDTVHYIRYFGADGERTMNITGVSMIEFEYDGEDFDRRETYYDILDEYTLCDGGYARIEWKLEDPGDHYDKGIVTWVVDPDGMRWEKVFGTDMKLINRKAGYSGFENFRNGNGQIIRRVYYDDNWLPARDDEYQYAEIDYQYDSDDPEDPAVYEAYFDKDGNPCEGITGAYARSMVYGGPKKNLLLEEAFYDAEGNPDTNVTTGAHKAVYTFDKNLLQTSVHYYNADGTASATRTGEAAMMREYNNRGNLLWEVTFGDDGNLATVNGTNAAQVHSYDYAGHHTGEKFFDAEGNPVTNSKGYACAIYEYDAMGNISSIAYYNAENMPTLVNCRAKVERTYDNAHHMTYELNIGTSGRPVLLNDGYAAQRITYDPETGMTTKVEYMDTDEKPVMLPLGYASYEVKYDTTGNLILRAYYDTDGNLVAPSTPGYAKLERQTDAQGRVTEEAYYNADGTLLLNRDGYAVTQTKYETNKTTLTYLDENRELADTAFGYAVKETITDYRGNVLSIAYYGSQNEPVTIADGYHKEERTWDTDGHQLSEKYTDANGDPAECPDGYAAFICEYDLNGNTTREVYYGADGKVTKVTAGAAEVRREYDGDNHLLNERYFDETGAPYMLRGDYAATECTYDAQGNLLTEAFYGVDGEAVISTKGYALKTNTYDIRGHLLTEEYSDGKGGLLTQTSGYARKEQTWDKHGNLLSEAWFDAENKPALRENSYGYKSYKYDNHNNCTE